MCPYQTLSFSFDTGLPEDMIFMENVQKESFFVPTPYLMDQFLCYYFRMRLVVRMQKSLTLHKLCDFGNPTN